MYKRIETNKWDFRTVNTKEYTHCYHTYPAMMIPQIARKLLKEYTPNFPVKLVLDPYMGSGTTLVESAILGIDSIGFDINPLARFIGDVKVTLYDIEKINESFEEIKNQIFMFDFSPITYNSDDYLRITKSEYWYSKDSLIKLKFLSDTINALPNNKLKPFFLIALSEVIREVSFTRNGEFKRYRISESKIPTYNVQPFKLFVEKTTRNIEGLKMFAKETPTFNAVISNCNSVKEIPADIVKPESVDMVVTSPPYGDSRTTVAYGQFSRWASEWFGFENAKNIDKTLMGGEPKKNTTFYSNSINAELELIKHADIKRYYEVVTFLDEYKNSMINVASTVKRGGKVCYVVGNRNVKGVQIPLDYFTAETFESCGFKHEKTYVRSIPNKRMPSKTSPTNKKGINVSTMTAEYIVILTKQ